MPVFKTIIRNTEHNCQSNTIFFIIANYPTSLDVANISNLDFY